MHRRTRQEQVRVDGCFCSRVEMSGRFIEQHERAALSGKNAPRQRDSAALSARPVCRTLGNFCFKSRSAGVEEVRMRNVQGMRVAIRRHAAVNRLCHAEILQATLPAKTSASCGMSVAHACSEAAISLPLAWMAPESNFNAPRSGARKSCENAKQSALPDPLSPINA